MSTVSVARRNRGAASRIVQLPSGIEPVSVREAVEAFLAERDLAPASRRKYRATLETLAGVVGDDTALADVDGRQLVSWLQGGWADASPATWNRHRATLRSFFAYCGRQRWVIDDSTEASERCRDHEDLLRTIPYAELEQLWGRRDIPLRERACGVCSMRRPPGPMRSSASTSRTSTWPTGGRSSRQGRRPGARALPDPAQPGSWPA